MSPEIMREVFPVKKEFKYCTKQVFEMRNICTVRYGLETLSFLGPKIWSTIPDEFQSLTTVKSFKKSIRKWKPSQLFMIKFKVFKVLFVIFKPFSMVHMVFFRAFSRSIFTKLGIEYAKNSPMIQQDITYRGRQSSP